MPTKYYRIVQTLELNDILKNRVIRRSAETWGKYGPNEVVFVLSEKATIKEMLALAEDVCPPGAGSHLIEIQILGPTPPAWKVEQDGSFENYSNAFAIHNDIQEDGIVSLKKVCMLQP